ncbi:MAG: hypothetical protein LBT78_08545 [Tannerella sp.]|jgi:amino acid transporter|nr:hypothetical protein [Tannerella sp.]
MKKSYLFPTCFQKIGWSITLPILAWALFQIIFQVDLNFDLKMFAFVEGNNFGSSSVSFFKMVNTSFFATFFQVLLIIGLCFVAFAKRRDEDEYISKIREQSLVWSMLVGSSVLVILTLLVYGDWYIYIILYDIDFVLLLFVCKFNYELRQLKRSVCQGKNESMDANVNKGLPL